MRYLSTRGKAPPSGLDAALVAGLAADGGLYVPESMPHLEISDFAGCDDLVRVGARLLRPFFAGTSLASELDAICHAALDIPAPLRALRTEHSWLLELFHGPTAAFKDFGARFLASSLSRLRDDAAPVRTILVATSGDTGAAVGAAFHMLPGFRVVILYPDRRVSPRQAHQLGCFGDNVQALRVDGHFDDCQRLVKRALSDVALQREVPLSSANSISLGRLLPQMGYFAHAALRHWRSHGRRAGFIVPTGNLGNALACLMARRCGLPIGPVLLATNANRVLSEFFAGGEYTPHASVATLANAMDVGAPSNFERLCWLYPGPDRLRRALSVCRVDDDAIRATLKSSRERFGALICPHTATALCAMQRRRESSGDHDDWICVATAHPAKFEQVVEPLIDANIAVPAALDQWLQRPASATPLPADYDTFCHWLRRNG